MAIRVAWPKAKATLLEVLSVSQIKRMLTSVIKKHLKKSTISSVRIALIADS
ncbi:MAG: hypothetical protein F6J90_37290 [Moorea sp. SIOASIH]|nr:hypothetical protein [Moorena sp. SIOASIH]